MNKICEPDNLALKPEKMAIIANLSSISGMQRQEHFGYLV